MNREYISARHNIIFRCPAKAFNHTCNCTFLQLSKQLFCLVRQHFIVHMSVLWDISLVLTVVRHVNVLADTVSVLMSLKTALDTKGLIRSSNSKEDQQNTNGRKTMVDKNSQRKI